MSRDFNKWCCVARNVLSEMWNTAGPSIATTMGCSTKATSASSPGRGAFCSLRRAWGWRPSTPPMRTAQCRAPHFTRCCYCVQSSLHPSRQELPWGAKKLGYLPRSSGQQEASQDSNPCLVQPRPTSTVSEHIACGVSEFIGQGLYKVCEEISYLTESRKSKLTEQVKPSAMSMCFSCVGYEAGQLSNLFLLS